MRIIILLSLYYNKYLKVKYLEKITFSIRRNWKLKCKENEVYFIRRSYKEQYFSLLLYVRFNRSEEGILSANKKPIEQSS